MIDDYYYVYYNYCYDYYCKKCQLMIEIQFVSIYLSAIKTGPSESSSSTVFSSFSEFSSPEESSKTITLPVRRGLGCTLFLMP